jgi:hypothetical protein
LVKLKKGFSAIGSSLTECPLVVSPANIFAGRGIYYYSNNLEKKESIPLKLKKIINKN